MPDKHWLPVIWKYRDIPPMDVTHIVYRLASQNKVQCKRSECNSLIQLVSGFEGCWAQHSGNPSEKLYSCKGQVDSGAGLRRFESGTRIILRNRSGSTVHCFVVVQDRCLACLGWVSCFAHLHEVLSYTFWLNPSLCFSDATPHTWLPEPCMYTAEVLVGSYLSLSRLLP